MVAHRGDEHATDRNRALEHSDPRCNRRREQIYRGAGRRDACEHSVNVVHDAQRPGRQRYGDRCDVIGPDDGRGSGNAK